MAKRLTKRLTPALRRRVLNLPLADRLALAQEIRHSCTEPHTPEERLAYLADKMQEVSGLDPRHITSRSQAAVWPLYLFIFVARREGYTQEAIGRVIKRDHSSICAAEKKVNNAFAIPAAYANELKLYNKYIDKL